MSHPWDYSPHVQASNPFGASSSTGMFGASQPVSPSLECPLTPSTHMHQLLIALHYCQAFGAASTSAFGVTSTPAFGSTTFGVRAAPRSWLLLTLRPHSGCRQYHMQGDVTALPVPTGKACDCLWQHLWSQPQPIWRSLHSKCSSLPMTDFLNVANPGAGLICLNMPQEYAARISYCVFKQTTHMLTCCAARIWGCIHPGIWRAAASDTHIRGDEHSLWQRKHSIWQRLWGAERALFRNPHHTRGFLALPMLPHPHSAPPRPPSAQACAFCLLSIRPSLFRHWCCAPLF